MLRHFSTRLLVSFVALGAACSREVALEERAQQGAADAQYALGLRYAKGEGATKDPAKGLSWLRKAADQGYAPAQVRIGNAYVSGDGIAKDFEEAVKWFRKAADQGNAQAEDHLGMMYAAGRGIAKDGTKATEWYRKAANQGFADAQDRLGVAYAVGPAAGAGVPKDYAEASKWFRKAAEQGYAQAQTDLGVLYADGMGVAKDYDEAIKWYQKAAAQGDAKAQSEILRLHRELAELSDKQTVPTSAINSAQATGPANPSVASRGGLLDEYEIAAGEVVFGDWLSCKFSSQEIERAIKQIVQDNMRQSMPSVTELAQMKGLQEAEEMANARGDTVASQTYERTVREMRNHFLESHATPDPNQINSASTAASNAIRQRYERDGETLRWPSGARAKILAFLGESGAEVVPVLQESVGGLRQYAAPDGGQLFAKLGYSGAVGYIPIAIAANDK